MSGSDPLHQQADEPDREWGSDLNLQCTCGQTHRLWDKKCPGCKSKNWFPRLLKKRQKIEKWADRSIELDVLPQLTKNQSFLESARKYNGILEEVVRRPFPKKQKKEDVNDFLRRVVGHFPALFKSTSPKQKAMGMDEDLKRSSVAMSRSAWTGTRESVNQLTATSVEQPQGPLLAKHAQHVLADLLNMTKPYMEALKTLQLAHNRMVTAYGPARVIFRRGHSGGLGKSLLDKARSVIKPVGSLLKFPTAIWQNDEELEELKRLDSSLSKFLEQAKWFREQHDKLLERNVFLMNTYRLSMRRQVIRLLLERYRSVDTEDRRKMVKQVMKQKGVGSFLARLFG